MPASRRPAVTCGLPRGRRRDLHLHRATERCRHDSIVVFLQRENGWIAWRSRGLGRVGLDGAGPRVGDADQLLISARAAKWSAAWDVDGSPRTSAPSTSRGRPRARVTAILGSILDSIEGCAVRTRMSRRRDIHHARSGVRASNLTARGQGAGACGSVVCGTCTWMAM